MKYFELDKEEKEILSDFDKDNFVSVDGVKNEKAKYRKYVDATLQKTKNINVRLSERDLQRMKMKALERGIPYQTLVTSVIHQYVNDKFKVGA